MTNLVVPLQWPVKTIPRMVQLTKANTPKLLMPANPNRTFYIIANDMVTPTLVAGVVNYTVFESLYVSFDPPQYAGATPKGIIIPPGGYLPSQFGGVSGQEIWIWSPLVTVASWTLTAYEGVNDPHFPMAA